MDQSIGVPFERVTVESLVGVDIRGKRAIVTQPQYRYQYEAGPPVVTLKKAEYRTEKGKRWLYIYFDGHSCGYSGWAWSEDHPDNPVVDLLGVR